MNASHNENSLRWLGWLLHGGGLLSVILTAAAARAATVRACVDPRQAIQQEADRLSSVLATKGDVFQEHRRLTQELSELENNTRAVRERIPDEPREAEFLGTLTKVAESVDLRIQNYARQNATAAPSHTEFDIRVEGIGSYASFCRFLDQLHQLPRIAVVRKLSLNSRDKTGEYPFDVVLTLFYRGGHAGESG